MKKVLLNLIISMSLTACHPSGEEVAGEYSRSLDYANEYIEMRADGSYTQYFKDGTTEERNEGTWEFEYKQGQWKLELDDYVSYVSPSSKVKSPERKKGSASVYWQDSLIMFYPDGYDEYNYYQKPAQPEIDKVAGVYQREIGNELEELSIKDDGVFVQQLSQAGQKHENIGNWNFKFQGGKWRLEFNEYIKYSKARKKIEKGYAAGFWINNQIEIFFSPEGYESYNYYLKE